MTCRSNCLEAKTETLSALSQYAESRRRCRHALTGRVYEYPAGRSRLGFCSSSSAMKSRQATASSHQGKRRGPKPSRRTSLLTRPVGIALRGLPTLGWLRCRGIRVSAPALIASYQALIWNPSSRIAVASNPKLTDEIITGVPHRESPIAFGACSRLDEANRRQHWNARSVRHGCQAGDRFGPAASTLLHRGRRTAAFGIKGRLELCRLSINGPECLSEASRNQIRSVVGIQLPTPMRR